MRLALLSAICFLLGCGREVPPSPLSLEVVGQEYDWYIRYPGEDGVLHSKDDVVAVQHMHVPAHTPLHIAVTSKDYLYTFRVPELNKIQMGVPDIVFNLEFDSGAPGQYVLKGDQMCGFAHASLIGEFIVEPPAKYKAWLAERQLEGVPPPRIRDKKPNQNP